MDPIEIQKRFQAMRAGGAGGQQMADYAEDLAIEAHDRARRGARIGLSVSTVVLLLITVGTGVGAAVVARGFSAGSADLGTLIGLGVSSVVCGVFAALTGRMALALRAPPRELVGTGVPARLVVSDYRRAPGSINVSSNESHVDLQRVAIDLEVTPDEGAAYSATVFEYLAGRAFVKLAPGARLAGYVDRRDPRRIFIDWRAKV